MYQADIMHQYPDAARAMTAAALEYMLSGPRWVNKPKRTSLMPYANGWHINDWIFYVPPRVDDETLAEIAELPPDEVDVIVPPWAACTARSALKVLLPHHRIDVYSIDTYVCMRVLWSSIDLNHSSTEAHVNLLRRYKQHVETFPAVNIVF